MNQSRGSGLHSSNNSILSDSNSASHGHVVQFYETDDHLLDVLTHFLAPGAQRGNPMVVMATPEHRKSVTERLRSQGVDTEALFRTGQLTFLDAQDTLSSFLIKDLPDK